jgi:hypothetical protein
MGTKGNLGPLLVVLCGPCKAHESGHRHVSSEAVSALTSGQAYVNVYTTKHPNGVVRGQIG